MAGLLAQGFEIQAQSLIFAGAEAAQPLTGQHHGPMPIAALEVELDGHAAHFDDEEL